MITIEEIRKNIQEAIILSGLTQTYIASELSIKRPTVQQYMSGIALPSLDTFANMCKLLDLDANDVLGINSVYKEKKRLIYG